MWGWIKSSDTVISHLLENNERFVISASLSLCWEGVRQGQKLRPITKWSCQWQNQLHFLVSTPASTGCRFSFFLLWPPGCWSISTLCPLHFSECFSQMISRTSQGTKPLFFPLATLMKPLHSPSLLTQIWKQKKYKTWNAASSLHRMRNNYNGSCNLSVLLCVGIKAKNERRPCQGKPKIQWL